MLALILSLTMAVSHPSILSVPVVHAEYLTKNELVAIATSTAERHGLTKKQVKEMLLVVDCESGWIATSTGALGERGLAQIYGKYHPDITEKQMLDPYFSLDFIARNLFKHPTWWTCYKLVTDGFLFFL